LPPPPTPLFVRVLRCFDAAANLNRLFAAVPKGGAHDLDCLNGIRVISMLWVILGHTISGAYTSLINVECCTKTPSTALSLYISFVCFWILFVWLYKKKVVTHVATRFSFSIIGSAFYAVDTFFFLSGFLASYFLLQQLEKTKKGKLKLMLMYYVHRFLRISPIYFFWLIVFWKVKQAII
jgi:peptidoglycan/LPS O-acetylase OafA/YrhL